MNSSLLSSLYQASFPSLHFLAQVTTAPGTQKSGTTVIVQAAGGGATPDTGLHWPWQKWLSFYSPELAIRTLITLALLVVLYYILSRFFRKPVQKYRLQGSTALGAFSVICYITLIAWHPLLMVDPRDGIAMTIHKLFAAIMCFVGLRYIDRLLVVPILTRISGGPPSRFIHQIVVAVIAMFVIAGYCSIAFGIEVGSFLAGSAVISIVLGLALQETLGNFFSGMVLQASVPFQTGDWIQIGSTEGRVVEMTWRAVTLITGANNHVLIPNSTVAKETIVNYHFPSVATATSVAVGLDYNIPPNDAKRVLVQAALDTPGVLADPPPSAGLISFDDSSIGYKVFFWINEPNKHGGVEQMVRTNIWYRVNQAGYSIPFPIRTVELTDAARKEAAAQESGKLRRLTAIRKAPYFSEIQPQLLEKLAMETREFPLAAGQPYFKQGDAGNSLYILLEGTVEVVFLRNDGKQITVHEITAPAVFGEVSAVTGQPRAATYRGKTDTRAIEIDREHLQSLFSADPTLMTHFSELIAQHQNEREELMKKVGAIDTGQPQQHESHNVLDRMRRLFTLRHH